MYKNREKHCNGPLFTYDGTSPGVKNSLLLTNIALKQYNSTIAYLNLEVSKKFKYCVLQKVDTWVFEI